MKLIILHGAPAVGKFTVAKELSKLTKYKLVHIHSVYDILEDIFTRDGYYTSLEIMQNMFLDIFEGAAKTGMEGLIFTYAHLADNNFSFPKRVVKRLKKYKVDVKFVHLVCDVDELKKRVVKPSRKKFKKTHDVKELNYLIKRHDYNSKFSNETIEIDTTNLSAKKTALEIKNSI